MNKHRFLAFTMLALATALGCAGVPDAEPESPSDEALIKLASELKSLVRVTPKAVTMQPKNDAPCAPWGLYDFDTHGAKRSAVFNIYVTPEGATAMNQAGAIFAPGTVILKQKLATPTSKDAELYTGMLKREKGFNPGCGDWEFFTLSGDARTVTTRGRIQSCMHCHKTHRQNDFVTKTYIKRKPVDPFNL